MSSVASLDNESLSFAVADNFDIGIIYLFKTSIDGVYKIGRTSSSLSARAIDHRHKFGHVHLERAVFVPFNACLEKRLLNYAYNYSDHLSTKRIRREIGSAEAFSLDDGGACLIKLAMQIDAVRWWPFERHTIPHISLDDYIRLTSLCHTLKEINYNHLKRLSTYTMYDKVLQRLRDHQW